jgi:hypothetical protein
MKATRPRHDIPRSLSTQTGLSTPRNFRHPGKGGLHEGQNHPPLLLFRSLAIHSGILMRKESVEGLAHKVFQPLMRTASIDFQAVDDGSIDSAG